MDVGIISIAFDSAAQQATVQQDYGITVPMGVDADHAVSEAYDVLKWAVGTGEPGHTFILVDEQGQIAWIRDYGSPDLDEPTMYVPTAELTRQIRDSLDSSSS